MTLRRRVLTLRGAGFTHGEEVAEGNTKADVEIDMFLREELKVGMKRARIVYLCVRYLHKVGEFRCTARCNKVGLYTNLHTESTFRLLDGQTCEMSYDRCDFVNSCYIWREMIGEVVDLQDNQLIDQTTLGSI